MLYEVGGSRRRKDWLRALIMRPSNQSHSAYSKCTRRAVGSVLLRWENPIALSLEEAINNDSYHSFAVAWGLSYPETDIGKITRLDEIEDIPQPVVVNREHLQVTKDMM